SIGMSKTATFVLGVSEIVGAVSIALGIYAQFGALLLAGAMLGTLYKKIFVWKTGFYAEKGYGWHYDLLLLLANLLILTTGGGKLILL
ncbi:MAG: DoxX family membrane protein, partial [Gillisia sp.]